MVSNQYQIKSLQKRLERLTRRDPNPFFVDIVIKGDGEYVSVILFRGCLHGGSKILEQGRS